MCFLRLSLVLKVLSHILHITEVFSRCLASIWRLKCLIIAITAGNINQPEIFLPSYKSTYSALPLSWSEWFHVLRCDNPQDILFPWENGPQSNTRRLRIRVYFKSVKDSFINPVNFSKVIVQRKIVPVNFSTNITSPWSFFSRVFKSDVPLGIVQSWYGFVA